MAFIGVNLGTEELAVVEIPDEALKKILSEKSNWSSWSGDSVTTHLGDVSIHLHLENQE